METTGSNFMATVFQKTTSDKCLILDAKEALIYPFDVGNWTEIRMAVGLSLTTAASNNGTAIAENNSFTTASSGFYFGIKNSSNANLPGVTGAIYAGSVSTADGNAVSFVNVGDGTGSFQTLIAR